MPRSLIWRISRRVSMYETSIGARGGLTRNGDERGRPNRIRRVDQEPPCQSRHPVAHELREARMISAQCHADI